MLSSHVERIVLESGRAVGVQLRGSRRRILRAKRAVISNASIWDTTRLLPQEALTDQQRDARMNTPRTGSFVHLHIGIDATGLPDDLESVHSINY